MAPRTLLAIDPGLQKLGWAFFTDQTLTRAGLSRTSCIVSDLQELVDIHARNLPCAEASVVEQMWVYPGGGKGDPNDLVRIAIVGACLAERKADSCSFVPAWKWKGQVPKEIHHARTRKILNEEENLLLTRANHDTMDAVALGLWALGRK